MERLLACDTLSPTRNPFRNPKDTFSKSSAISLQKLFSYRLGVELLANSQNSTIHYNKDIEYSMIVMSKLFDIGNNQVNVLNGNFNSIICNNNPNDFLKNVEKFLILGGNINVILTDYNPNEYNETIALLKDYASDSFYKSKIKVKTISSCPVNSDGKPFHFTVTDDKAFREEFDIEKFTAKFSFNRPEKAQELNKIFFDLFDSTQAKTLI